MKIFAANWKLQKTPQQAKEFCENFKKAIDDKSKWSGKEVFIFPQNFSLQTVIDNLVDQGIFVGPQNIHFEKSGAFTGENSAEFAKAMGAGTVLLGHSERRQYFAETPEALNKKIKLCQQLDLLPVYCIGETLAQREAEQTDLVCIEQLNSVLSDIDKQKRLVVAYEPVWAIGTGKVATIEQVADVHAKLYKHLIQMGFTQFSLLYGGSVKPDNSATLLQVPHVDGFLIGGASLEVESFCKICFAN